MTTVSVPVNNTNKSINTTISCLALGLEGAWKMLFQSDHLPRILLMFPRKGPKETGFWAPDMAPSHSSHKDMTSNILSSCQSYPASVSVSCPLLQSVPGTSPLTWEHQTSAASVQPSCLHFAPSSH